MTQYDAGPGEWSDRPWEDPERKPKPQAKRRRVTLPPWALLAILVAIIILLCLSLVAIVRAIRGDRDEGTPTPSPTATQRVLPTSTSELVAPTPAVTPTQTVILPGSGPTATPITEIGIGATVVVQGTQAAGLNLREQATTYSKVVGNAKEDEELTVLAGPKESDGHVWWQVRTPDGVEGWAAVDWLVLKTE